MRSFPHRMIAVPARILLALFTDPLATVADVVAYAALALMFAGLSVLIVRIERWISRRLALHRRRREQRAFEEITQHLGDVFPADVPSDAECLPGVTRIGPASSAPVRPAFTRRRIAGLHIPRRRVRHTTPSDRSPR